MVGCTSERRPAPEGDTRGFANTSSGSLRPGGRFAVAAWDMPEKNPFFPVLAAILRQYMEIPPFDPKAPSPFRLAWPGELEALFSGPGFERVQVETWPMTWLRPPVAPPARGCVSLSSP